MKTRRRSSRFQSEEESHSSNISPVRFESTQQTHVRNLRLAYPLHDARVQCMTTHKTRLESAIGVIQSGSGVTPYAASFAHSSDPGHWKTCSFNLIEDLENSANHEYQLTFGRAS